MWASREWPKKTGSGGEGGRYAVEIFESSAGDGEGSASSDVVEQSNRHHIYDERGATVA